MDLPPCWGRSLPRTGSEKGSSSAGLASGIRGSDLSLDDEGGRTSERERERVPPGPVTCTKSSEVVEVAEVGGEGPPVLEE